MGQLRQRLGRIDRFCGRLNPGLTALAMVLAGILLAAETGRALDRPAPWLLRSHPAHPGNVAIPIVAD